MRSNTNDRYLIWGEHGWIAGQLIDLMKKQNKDVHGTSVRMQNQSEVCKVIDEVRPTHIINCAGKTGRPNIDWCEDHKIETIESNVLGTLILAQACYERNMHLTTVATGCIYMSTYTPDHTTLLSDPFTEPDTPNFSGSFYSYTKIRAEDILKHYPQSLILRVRMPVSDDLHPRSFVTKIKSYAHVVNIPNSHTLLHDHLPVWIALAEHRETGVYNCTNPGAATHNQVLGLYQEIVDPTYSWKNFSLEAQGGVVKAERSNCELDCSKLMGKVKEYQGEGYDVAIPEILEGYRAVFTRMKGGMQQKGGAQVVS